jgi:glycerol kinase
MQMQADFVGAEIIRPKMIETTSAGAAFLAGLGVGFWSNLEEIKKVWEVDREFKPMIAESQRRERMKHWHEAVQRTLWSDKKTKTKTKTSSTKTRSRSKVRKKK